MNHLFLVFIGGWLFICSIQDVKRKQIHIALLCIGMVTVMFGAMFFIDISIKNRLMGFLPGGLLLGLNLITKNQIGIADGIIVCIIGGALGFYISSGILLFALFLSAIISLILIVLKKVKRKTTIPFIPFLFAGYVGVLVFT